MSIKELVHADKTSTHTDRKLIDISLVCDMVCLVLLTVLLILKMSLPRPVILLFVLLAAAAGAVFVISAFYTVAIRLRKKSVKVYLSIALLAIAAILTAIVIAV